MRRPSPALVVATIALFVALGGTSIAATQLARNSVGTAQLKANAVTSSKVKDGSLLAADFSAGQLPAGAQGERGPAGPQGATGPAGANGITAATGAWFQPPIQALILLPGQSSRLAQVATPITLTTRSRLIAAATVSFSQVSENASVKSRVRCVVETANPADPDPEAVIRLAPVVDEQMGPVTNESVEASLATTGSAVVPAGSYSPYAWCINVFDSTGDVRIYDAALSVIVAPD